MTSEREFEVLLRSWIDGSAPSAQPEGLLASVVTATAHTRPRPAWLVRLRGDPMPEPSTSQLNRFAPLAATATAILVAILFGVGLFLRLSPNIGPSPAPGPMHSRTPEPTAPASQTSSAVPSVSRSFAYIVGDQRTGQQLWIANMDGTGAHELIPGLAQELNPGMGGNAQAPAWSSDGTRLVFAWAPVVDAKAPQFPAFGASRFYLTDVSGRTPQLVDTGCVAPCTGDSDAAFSRDGTHLVFVRSLDLPPTPERPGPGKTPGPTPASVIATIDLSTGRVVELASTMIVDCPLLPGQRAPGVGNCEGLQNRNPRWSADGTQIVFSQDIPYDMNGPQINGDSPPPPGPALYVVDGGGRNLHQISPSGWFGDWSPDGARIVFNSASYVPVPRAGSGTGYTLVTYSDIYTIRPDGTDIRRLTSDKNSGVPGWTTDGRILFLRNGEAAQLWIMDADGSNAAQLSFSPLLISPILNAMPVSRPTQP